MWPVVRPIFVLRQCQVASSIRVGKKEIKKKGCHVKFNGNLFFTKIQQSVHIQRAKKKLNEGAQTQKVEKRKRKAGTPQLQK